MKIMESLCLQRPVNRPMSSCDLASCGTPVRRRCSLSLSSDPSPLILRAKFRHQALVLQDAPSRLPTVVCCHPQSNGSVKHAVDQSTFLKTFAEADEQMQSSLLKKMGSDVVTHLKETCIYLVGMMGSGKTTVGKLLAEALGYQFFDSDKLVEEVDGRTVAQFFKQENEEGFRDAETQVLRHLSYNGRSVVIATGGGIVVRPANWTYLKLGLTVWLDVPLEALAERVVAAGTHSRPLLGEADGKSAHSQALATLSDIYESRAPFYRQADVVVSLQDMLSELQYQHVRDITPELIAYQVLEEFKKFNICNMGKDAAPAA